MEGTVMTTIPPRADRRRIVAEAKRQMRYAETGFSAPSIYAPFQPTPQRPGVMRFTPEQLHDRAVRRMIIRNHQFKQLTAVLSKHALVIALDDRAPHASRSTAERKHKDRSLWRERARKAYEAGLKLAQPLRYLHSAAKWRAITAAGNQEAPLAMAA